MTLRLPIVPAALAVALSASLASAETIIVPIERVNAAPAAAPKPQLLVLPLADQAHAGTEKVESFSQALAAELAKADRWHVLTQQDLRSIVAAEQLKQLLGCGESCASDLSTTVGAELVVSGQLGLVGTTPVLTVAIVEPKSGRAKARVSRKMPDAQALLAVARVADELVARAFNEPLGELSVTTDPAGAIVLVDGREFGTTPLPPTALRPGPHRLVVQKDGFIIRNKTLEIADGATAQEILQLEPVEEQMKVADVAKVAEAAALAGAEAAAKTTQETVTKAIAGAETVAKTSQESATKAEAAAKASQDTATKAEATAKASQDTATKAEAAAKATQDSVTKALADASAKDAERERASLAALEERRKEAEKREAELRRATEEAKRVAAEAEAKAAASKAAASDVAARTKEAETNASRAEEEAREARATAERAAKDAEERAEEARKEAEAEASRQRARSDASIAATEKRLEQSLGLERKRTAGFGLRVQMPLLDETLSSAVTGQGGASTLLLVGLDGKIPLFWRVFLGLRIDALGHVPSGAAAPTGTATEQRTVPGGLLDGSIGLGVHLPVAGPLFAELGAGIGARATRYLRRTKLEDGTTVDDTSTAVTPTGVAQVSIGVGFGPVQIAATGTLSQPFGTETAAPHVGNDPSIAGFGRLVAVGGQLGASW